MIQSINMHHLFHRHPHTHKKTFCEIYLNCYSTEIFNRRTPPPMLFFLFLHLHLLLLVVVAVAFFFLHFFIRRSTTRALGLKFLPFILTVRLLLARRPVFRHHHQHHLHHHCRLRIRRYRRLMEGKVFVSIYFVILKVSWRWVWRCFLFRLSFRR